MQPEGFDDALGASYRLLDRLGEGASGEVWRAVDKRTDEIVATKLLRREHLADRDLVGRFIQERSVLTTLRHPAVVEVRDLVVEGERLAIVMEHVDGGSLRDVLRERGTLAPALAVDVAAAVLEGLASAHQRDVVHRDVKPDNVLLARDWESGEPGSVKLVDFGIARIITDRQRTATGLLGTPEYMSPELLTRGTAESPADVYGVGIMLYELLAGRTPFAGPGNEYTIAHRHVTAEPPPLDVPAPLAAQLEALLEKDPTRRPSAAAAAVALRGTRAAVAGTPALAPQAGPEDFDTARGPSTVVRGLTPETPAAPSGTDDEPGAPTDLGAPGQQTIVRPMQRRAVVEEDDDAPAAPARRAGVPGWKDPKLIGVVAAALVLLVGAVLFVTLTGGEDDASTEDPTPEVPAAGPAEAEQPSELQAVSGLGLERAAVWDPETEQVQLTLTYSADRAPLTGPMLEVLPNPDGNCPTDVAWDVPQETNIVSTTSIDAECAWALDVGTIEPGQTVQRQATFTLPLEVDEGGDASAALQEWLAGVEESTTTALTDTRLSTAVDSYPAQRLQGISVVVPSSTFIERVVPVTVFPEWPSGTGTVAIFATGSSGEPNSVLAAVAGGTDGVSLSSGCAPSVVVTAAGLVSALSQVEDCTVGVELGNVPETASPPFAVAFRDS